MAERRVCSVLFADLVGFTPLSESRDPAAAVAVAEARDIATRLRCRPRLDRIAGLAPAEPKLRV